MSTQRRTSTSSTGGATPGRDEEYPTDTFDSVVGTDEAVEETGWDELVGPTSHRPAAASYRQDDVPQRDVTAEDDERPTQVFGAIREEPPEPSAVAEQLFGGSAVPEDDDTAVFARYRDTDPDPRDTAGTPAAHPATQDDVHTEQFAAYRDRAHDEPPQTPAGGSHSWSGPSVPPVSVPVPMTPPIPPIPTGLGRPGVTKEAAAPDRTGAPEAPGTSGGKRALRERPTADAQQAADEAQRAAEGRRAPEGQHALDEQRLPGGAGVQPEGQAGPNDLDLTPGDEPAAEPVLDKKAAKRLAREQQQAAKDAAKAEKAGAAQAAKDAKAAAEKAAKDAKLAAKAAKAAKKAGRGRGATEASAAAAEAAAATEAAATEAAATEAAATEVAAAEGRSATPSEAGAEPREPAVTTTAGEADGAASAAQPDSAQAVGTTPAVAAAPVVRRRKAPVLVVLLLLFIAGASGAAAWLFQQQAVTASKQRPSSNIALLDKSATSDVVAQVSKAVEAIYSYDSASLDQSESLALSQITGSYVSEFKDNFAAVRALPPQQRASLSSKVAAAGVITLTERRASLLVMLDQVGRRGDNAPPVNSEVRLSVTAQRVDGQWKVSDISQR